MISTMIGFMSVLLFNNPTQDGPLVLVAIAPTATVDGALPKLNVALTLENRSAEPIILYLKGGQYISTMTVLDEVPGISIAIYDHAQRMLLPKVRTGGVSEEDLMFIRSGPDSSEIADYLKKKLGVPDSVDSVRRREILAGRLVLNGGQRVIINKEYDMSMYNIPPGAFTARFVYTMNENVARSIDSTDTPWIGRVWSPPVELRYKDWKRKPFPKDWLQTDMQDSMLVMIDMLRRMSPSGMVMSYEYADDGTIILGTDKYESIDDVIRLADLEPALKWRFAVLSQFLKGRDLTGCMFKSGIDVWCFAIGRSMCDQGRPFLTIVSDDYTLHTILKTTLVVSGIEELIIFCEK